MINELTAKKVLDAALSTGGDFSELFCEDTVSHNLTAHNSSIETAMFSHIHGAGVRVLSGETSAYAYTSDTSEESLIRTALAAAAILKERAEARAKDFSCYRNAMTMQIPFSSVNNDKRAALMRRAVSAAKATSPEISQVFVRYIDVVRHIEVFNSDGIHSEDIQPRTRLAVTAIATKGTESEEGYCAPGYSCGFEAYTDKIDIEKTAKRAADTAVLMLHADDCPAGRVPVVIDGGFGGVILHEACVHGLEATSVAKGNSVFCGKLGQKIAADCVNAVDDGTLPGEWGTTSIDDEGYPTRRNVLIENGILKSYLVDRLGSRIMNHPMTGSSRRQDYTFAPTSRMNNTFFAGGTDDAEEMIRTMGDGLFATKMGGGSVMPLTGEFNFAVAEGYLVRDGKIVKPVKGAALVGKGADILLKIDRIGRNEWLEPGMCGSLSGMIPTTVGQPRIRVSEITVGGKGGKF